MSMAYKKALQRFEDAVRAHEFLGGQPPEDRPAIEREYEEARVAIVRKLAYRDVSKSLKALTLVEGILYELIGLGGGDGGTITQFANRIVHDLRKLV